MAAKERKHRRGEQASTAVLERSSAAALERSSAAALERAEMRRAIAAVQQQVEAEELRHAITAVEQHVEAEARRSAQSHRRAQWSPDAQQYTPVQQGAGWGQRPVPPPRPAAARRVSYATRNVDNPSSSAAENPSPSPVGEYESSASEIRLLTT